jgi:hypothetical protein
MKWSAMVQADGPVDDISSEAIVVPPPTELRTAV